MKINEFIEEYKKNPEIGRKKLNVKKYLPIEVKAVIFFPETIHRFSHKEYYKI